MSSRLLASFSNLLNHGPKKRKPSANSSKRFTTQLEVCESRTLLSAVSFNGGTLEFSADAGDADEITISAPSPSTLQFVVGNGDSIALAPAIAADANFTLSSGDTVLNVNVGSGGISLTDVELFSKRRC